jgi:hypothetical protein
VTALSTDTVSGAELIPLVDTTSKKTSPADLAAYTIDTLHSAAVITSLGDTHQLSVFTAGDDEKIITFANLSAWIVDEIEAITTGTVIVSGDKVVYSDGGVLKQIDIDTVVAFINSENAQTAAQLGAQVDALATATLGDTDEYLVEQGGVAKKTLWTAMAARTHTQFLAYQQSLSAVVTIVDADTLYVDDGGTAKKVTCTVLATYMLAEIKTGVLESAWDDYAALGGAANATDVFLLERSSTGKTVTGANLASYVISTQSSAAAVTPSAAGDDLLMYRSGTQKQVDIDVLATYVLKSGWLATSGNPVASGDEMIIGRSNATKSVTVDQIQTFVLSGIQATVLDTSGLGAATLGVGDLFNVWNGSTAEKITLANLETQLWTDFDAYVTALGAVTTPLDADFFYVIQSGTPKKVTADVFVSYIDDELWADSSALTPVLAGDDIFVRRSGTSYAVDIDVLATYINLSVQGAVLDFSALGAATPNAADRFVVDDSGTEKKLTLANLETKLWADFDAYVTALGAVVTVTNSDLFYVIQGGTPKLVTPVELATYMSISDGDVSGPVSTTEHKLPQWDSTNKLLKDGVTLETTITAGAMTDSQVPTCQAVDEFVTAGGSIDINAITDLGEAITDADLLLVDNGATGTNRKATFTRVFAWITAKLQALSAKTVPIGADILTIQDSAAANALKELTLTNLALNLNPGLATVAGTGITGAAASYVAGVVKEGTIFKTTICIDIAGLRSTAAGDIIGDDGSSNVAHLGQITAAVNGTIFAGKITCLEVPAGGDPDIDLYSATEATGVEDTAISTLTETQLINAGDHVVNLFKSLTAFPAANEYLYLVAGDTTDADFTTGILLIEFWGK